MTKNKFIGVLLVLGLIGILAWGCSAPADEGDKDVTEVEGFPVKDPSTPFALDEKGLITLANDQPAEIIVQRDDGSPIFKFIIKSGGISDPKIQVTVRTIELELPENLAASYVPISSYAFEMHVIGETGYGFSLRPKIEFYFTAEEIAAAKSQGAALDPLKGNLLILYMEQRAGQWVAQKSVSLDEAASKLTVSNIAGTGAWWLVAVKAP